MCLLLDYDRGRKALFYSDAETVIMISFRSRIWSDRPRIMWPSRTQLESSVFFYLTASPSGLSTQLDSVSALCQKARFMSIDVTET